MAEADEEEGAAENSGGHGDPERQARLPATVARTQYCRQLRRETYPFLTCWADRMAAARLNSRFSESIDHFFWLSAQMNMRCRNTLVNFRRMLRLQLLDLAVEALEGWSAAPFSLLLVIALISFSTLCDEWLVERSQPSPSATYDSKSNKPT